jgi:hypothetical protein
LSLEAQIAEAVGRKVSADLPALIAEAVEALRQGPGLDDKASLAAKLKISPRQVDVLRTKGLPVLMVGDLVRFDFGAVLEFLKNRQGLAGASEARGSKTRG